LIDLGTLAPAEAALVDQHHVDTGVPQLASESVVQEAQVVGINPESPQIRHRLLVVGVVGPGVGDGCSGKAERGDGAHQKAAKVGGGSPHNARSSAPPVRSEIHRSSEALGPGTNPRIVV
jgi:hypothetical protein